MRRRACVWRRRRRRQLRKCITTGGNGSSRSIKITCKAYIKRLWLVLFYFFIQREIMIESLESEKQDKIFNIDEGMNVYA